MTKDRYRQHALTAGSWRPSSSRFHWKQLYCWGRGGRKQHSKHISEDHTEVMTGSVTHRPLNISLEDGEWKCVCTVLCEKRFLSTPPRGTCGRHRAEVGQLGRGRARGLITGQVTSLLGVCQKPGKDALEAPAQTLSSWVMGLLFSDTK